jgi:hypothetical protein
MFASLQDRLPKEPRLAGITGPIAFLPTPDLWI